MSKFGRIFFISLITLAIPGIIWAATGDGAVKTFQKVPFFDGEMTTHNYIQALFNIAIGVAAIIVVLRMMLVGTTYVLTESVIKKRDAKKEIGNAFLGLIIILGSILLLETINPQLINLNFFKNAKPIPIEYSDPIDEIKFEPGQIFEASKIAALCGNGTLSTSVSASCVRKNEEALLKSCLHNGGTKLGWKYDLSINLGGYSYYSYTCE